MNNTLDHKGYRFFQSSYKEDESATILSVNKDPGKVPTYVGYFLLFAGLIINLFSKNGRFRKLSHKKYTIERKTIKKPYKKLQFFYYSFIILLLISCFYLNLHYITYSLFNYKI